MFSDADLLGGFCFELNRNFSAELERRRRLADLVSHGELTGLTAGMAGRLAESATWDPSPSRTRPGQGLFLALSR
jgi:hypothetical protein